MDSKLYSSTPFGIRKLIITINFFTFFSLLSFNAFAQNITLQINNASNHQPITNVRIITNDSILANTNEEGKVVLSKTVLQNRLVIFSALGYEDAQKQFPDTITEDYLTFSLQDLSELEEIIITVG